MQDEAWHTWSLAADLSVGRTVATRPWAGVTPWPSLTLWGNDRGSSATVGATARHLASYAPAALKGDAGWSRPQVEDAIRRLMAEHLAIHDFDWDDHFAKDLGVD
jgi:hypothetical protein